MFRRSTQKVILVASLSLASLLSSTNSYSQSDSLRRTEGEEVIVTGFQAEEGVTPVPLEEIRRARIEELSTTGSPTKAAAYTPSTTYFSQSGTDIGYTFLTIRGFEQRRLSIMVNGVPQNDPEDHNVYWLNMPGLLDNAGRIQVQRGAGSAFYGPPAIGGSINVETAFPTQRGMTLTGGVGSFNTFKGSIDLASGLVFDNWLFHANVSRTETDGYRNQAFAKLTSYHAAARYVNDVHTLQFNAYGGIINDGLDYYGLYPAFGDDLRDPVKRKKNISESFIYERRDEEEERYFQPHYEIISEYTFDPMVKLNNTFFYVQGTGHFDFDGTWIYPFRGYSHSQYYRLTKPYADLYGFTPLSDTLNALGNELTRAYVGNKQFGWLPRLDIELGYGRIHLGAELRSHSSLHYGTLLQAERLPTDLPSDYRFYEYDGSKQILSPFVASTFQIDEGLTIFSSLQLVAQKYGRSNEKPFFIDTALAVTRGVDPGWHTYEFEVAYLFLNPRLGLGLDLSDELGAFVSAALTTREPRLKDYYDAEFFSEPNFNKLPSGRYDFNDPQVVPEQLRDFEAGLTLKQTKLSKDASIRGSVTAFFMGFRNELTKTGSVDRFGSAVVTNAQRTEHYGIEYGFDLIPVRDLSIELNAAHSKHRFKEFTEQSLDFTGKQPIGFPTFTANGIISYQPFEFFRVTALGRYVGSTYGDLENSEDYRNPDYFVLDAIATIRFPLAQLRFFELKMQMNNVLDRIYTSYADQGSGFFVAAPRHGFVTISLGI